MAVNDSAQTQSDKAVTINVLGNDFDPDGSVDPDTVAIVTAPASGSAVVNTNGTITYTPTTLGNNTFTYTVEDNLGRGLQCGDRHRPRQHAAGRRQRLGQTRSDTAVTINVLANDHDPDGSLNPGTVTLVSPPASGSAVVNPDGTITYTPGTTLGNNTFTYTVKDNLGAVSNAATVTVFVHAPPTAVDDSAQTRSDTAVTINVLANDFVPAGTLVPSSVTIVTAPASGSTVANADGTITYTPGATVGNNTFTYTAANTSGDVSNAATVTVFVHEPPVAVNDSVLARSDRSATIAVLANDFDTDGTLDPTTVTIVSAPSSGSTIVNGNGTITFTPGNVLGNVTFTYTVKDDVGACLQRGHGHGLRRRAAGRGQRLGPDARQLARHHRRARQRSRCRRLARSDHGDGGDAPQQRLGAWSTRTAPSPTRPARPPAM